MATTETILEATIKAGVEHFGGFPSGTMIAFAGKGVPDGWLLCNGALVSRKTYAKLFAAIGTDWGAGDGSTTFKLPDADGRVMQGVTNASKVGKYLAAGLPNITGSIYDNGNKGSQLIGDEPLGSGCFSIVLPRNKVGIAGDGDYIWGCTKLTFNASSSTQIYGGNTSVQPNALQALIIIKV